uniref:Homeodomain-only protein n=2 Tax=Oryzias latipes TaxID=8090 RepID=A0A3B3HP56_ORYLA
MHHNGDEMMMTLKHEQIQQLEKNFLNFSKNPDELQIILIASECGLSVEETEKWFKWRNAYWRKAEGLPAEAGSVLD